MRTYSKAQRGPYKVVVREPSWATAATLWNEFGSPAEAEEFVRDVVSSYPEGTLVFIAGTWTKNYNPYTVKSFVVNEYGELSRRPRKWVPNEKVPREWVRGAPEGRPLPLEPSEPEDPFSVLEGGVEGLDTGEQEAMRQLVERMAPERFSRGEYNKLRAAYDRAVQDREYLKTAPYFRPEDLTEEEWKR